MAAALDKFFQAIPPDNRYHLELRTDLYLREPVFEVLEKQITHTKNPSLKDLAFWGRFSCLYAVIFPFWPINKVPGLMAAKFKLKNSRS
jgi:hypothetical protein